MSAQAVWVGDISAGRMGAGLSFLRWCPASDPVPPKEATGAGPLRTLRDHAGNLFTAYPAGELVPPVLSGLLILCSEIMPSAMDMAYCLLGSIVPVVGVALWRKCSRC